ncbi:MAG: hypothetical protein J6L84_02860 [Clostridiales bacterium]|nr:hypothetical protein [Clostridiales bacterium]MBP3809825.1 hypothetical protein [Clostridiales bacterium]
MKYYIANLAVHVVVTLIMIVSVIVFSNRNRKRKVRYVATYFLPTALAVVTAFYMFYITGPRLLDLSDVATQNYYSYTGVIEERSLLNNTLVIDGDTYYINPLRELPPEGSKVRIRFTRFCNYVISVESVETLDISGAIDEEMETAVEIPG